MEHTLTKREYQILHLYAKGFSNQEVADSIGTARKTVENQNTTMRAKLGGSKNIALALIYARKEGLID